MMFLLFDATLTLEFLWATGQNSMGQLGINTSQPMIQSFSQGKHAFAQISQGNRHAIGIDEQGGVWTWGDGVSGQSSGLGYPVELESTDFAGRTIVQADGGDRHSVALDSDGDVWGWGDSGRGQLCGLSGGAVPQKIDRALFGGLAVTYVTAQDLVTLAVTSDGALWACGLCTPYVCPGITKNTVVSKPLQIVQPGYCSKAFVGSNTLFLIDTHQKLFARGKNSHGQLCFEASQSDSQDATGFWQNQLRELNYTNVSAVMSGQVVAVVLHETQLEFCGVINGQVKSYSNEDLRSVAVTAQGALALFKNQTLITVGDDMVGELATAGGVRREQQVRIGLNAVHARNDFTFIYEQPDNGKKQGPNVVAIVCGVVGGVILVAAAVIIIIVFVKAKHTYLKLEVVK